MVIPWNYTRANPSASLRAKVSATKPDGSIPTTLGGKLLPVSVLARREFGLRALRPLLTPRAQPSKGPEVPSRQSQSHLNLDRCPCRCPCRLCLGNLPLEKIRKIRSVSNRPSYATISSNCCLKPSPSLPDTRQFASLPAPGGNIGPRRGDRHQRTRPAGGGALAGLIDQRERARRMAASPHKRTCSAAFLP